MSTDKIPKIINLLKDLKDLGVDITYDHDGEELDLRVDNCLWAAEQDLKSLITDLEETYAKETE